jgi:hypothetical protein
MIPNIPNFDAGFLPHLSLDGILERFARFDETRNCRIVVPQEFLLLMPAGHEFGRVQ